jgi:hypothetical protein
MGLFKGGFARPYSLTCSYALTVLIAAPWKSPADCVRTGEARKSAVP